MKSSTYDGSDGLPYIRISSVRINYPESGNPTISFEGRSAVQDANKDIHYLDAQVVPKSISLDDTMLDTPISISRRDTTLRDAISAINIAIQRIQTPQ